MRQPSFYVYVPHQEIHPINIWEDLGGSRKLLWLKLPVWRVFPPYSLIQNYYCPLQLKIAIIYYR